MRRSNIASLVLPAALCAPVPALASAQPSDGVVALDNVHIVEAEHNRVSALRCVRVQGNRIVAVTASGEPACAMPAPSTCRAAI